MPRDGSDIYHTPPGTPGVTNTTIASTPYNGYLADIEQDLNLPRPIVAGGTGANNAATALTNLGGENAGQVVTNYDSFPFAAGSFYSAAGATSAPTANAFRGIAYITDSSNITVEARDATTAINYIRQKTAGVWGTWNQDLTANPAYLLKAGDVMTGDLKISEAGPDFILNKASGTAGTQNNIWGMTNNVPRWVMQFGNEISEAGSNAGSDFTLQRYSDAGAFLSNSFVCDRSDGSMSVYGDLWSIGGTIISALTSTTGTFKFGNAGTKYLTYDGTNYTFAGGGVFVANGPVGAAAGNGFILGSNLFAKYSSGDNYNYLYGSDAAVHHQMGNTSIDDYLLFHGLQFYTNAFGTYCGGIFTSGWQIGSVGTPIALAASGGVTVGSPTGGNKGAGTINATALYDDNVLLTCYVAEAVTTGAIDVAYWDSRVPDTVIPAQPARVVPKDGVWVEIEPAQPEKVIHNQHSPARKFQTRLGTPHDPTTIAGQRKHMQDKKHLTPYPNPVSYNEQNRPSAGAWVQRGVEMDELLFAYITQLEDRIKALEAKNAP